jgi:hypothetical protein
VGATREHVTNVMSALTRSGLIKTDSSTAHLIILDPEKLSKAQ